MKPSPTIRKQHSFLQGGGQMGELTRNYHWENTPIGSPDNWPQSLRTTLSIILNSKFPMFLFWGPQSICFYNDAYRPSLGNNGKHPHALGKPGIKVWPEIWNEIGPQIEAILKGGEASWHQDQLLPIYRNGKMEDVYWTYSYSPVIDEKGVIAGVFVTCVETTGRVQDSTRQKQFAEELSKQVKQRTAELETTHEILLSYNTHLQNIINIFTSALQVLEPVIEAGDVVDFRYKLTNEAYAAYTGKKPGELVGRKVSELFPGYFQTDSFKNIREVALTGNPKIWENHYAADGLDIYNEMGAVKMGNDIVVHLTDFTTIKKLQLELLRNIAELKRSNQNLEEFAHAASHDLKEPIRKIHFFTGQLKEQLAGQLNQVQKHSFERIENASKRMSNLIDDLLTYSHVSQSPHEMQQVDVSEIIQRVQEDLELDIKQKNVCMEVGPLPSVQGFRRQLQQLFQNLISNAIKYSKKEVAPLIQITASIVHNNEQPYHQITIQDNGIGFDNAYNEKIFQMFTRLHGKNEYSGTGIGLSIVKKVVENHNGFITAESTPGQGAIFYIHIPVKQF